jgi:hypothetical protein
MTDVQVAVVNSHNRPGVLMIMGLIVGCVMCLTSIMVVAIVIIIILEVITVDIDWFMVVSAIDITRMCTACLILVVEYAVCIILVVRVIVAENAFVFIVVVEKRLVAENTFVFTVVVDRRIVAENAFVFIVFVYVIRRISIGQRGRFAVDVGILLVVFHVAPSFSCQSTFLAFSFSTLSTTLTRLSTSDPAAVKEKQSNSVSNRVSRVSCS